MFSDQVTTFVLDGLKQAKQIATALDMINGVGRDNETATILAIFSELRSRNEHLELLEEHKKHHPEGPKEPWQE